MRTFFISTLGCKVNSYESEQIATLLRQRGLRQVDNAPDADLRIVNTCSVTIQASSKSRQTVRRLTRSDPPTAEHPSHTLVVGCWATSNPDDAQALPGVNAVIGHHDDLASQIDSLLNRWTTPDQPITLSESTGCSEADRHAPLPPPAPPVPAATARGTISLPVLDQRQAKHQRAFMKIQDGCDAHCTYCIIPSLRSHVWSKSIDDAVAEAQTLTAAGHREIVLTGIFLGAYGHPTALRRRQDSTAAAGRDLPALVDALCTRVPDLARLRLSSLEPGDLTDRLLAVMKRHRQVTPHFHLPLQSGSDALLRRMNRQYTRDDYLRMIDRARDAFDKPAFTTDIIVGFPGETDAEFARTLDVVDHARFIHIHAFSYSPRPKTAAARWTKDFIRGPVVNDRIAILRQRADAHSLAFRQQFLGQDVELLVEKPSSDEADLRPLAGHQHGRCERYFAVHFPSPRPLTGHRVRATIERVEPHLTLARLTDSTPTPESATP